MNRYKPSLRSDKFMKDNVIWFIIIRKRPNGIGHLLFFHTGQPHGQRPGKIVGADGRNQKRRHQSSTE